MTDEGPRALPSLGLSSQTTTPCRGCVDAWEALTVSHVYPTVCVSARLSPLLYCVCVPPSKIGVHLMMTDAVAKSNCTCSLFEISSDMLVATARCRWLSRFYCRNCPFLVKGELPHDAEAETGWHTDPHHLANCHAPCTKTRGRIRYTAPRPTGRRRLGYKQFTLTLC